MTNRYPNSGTLGRNKRKETEKHPDFSGSCEIGGLGYWISAWVKEKDGERFFSLSFKPKEDRARQGDYGDSVSRTVAAAQRTFPGAQVTRDTRRPADDLDGADIPF